MRSFCLLISVIASITAAYGCPRECRCTHPTVAKCSGLPPNTNIRDLIPKLNPNITELDLSNNGLSRFEAIGFARFKKLRKLTLNENKLTDVPDNLSVWLPSLREIVLHSNYLLKSLSRQSLQSAFNLEKLDARDSGITELASGIFYNNTRLVNLNLQYNKLQRIEAEAFSGLHHLQVLNLDHNQMVEMSPNLLWPLRRLHMFTASSNRMKKVVDGLFKHNAFLSVINLKNNEINHLEEASFQGLRNVSSILLQHNNIETFPVQVFKDTVLRDAVFLNHNPLRCECYIVSLELRWLRLDGKIRGRCQTPAPLKGLRISALTRKQLACTNCDFNRCKNNATCGIEAEHYVCRCAPGFEGQFCEAPVKKGYSKSFELIVTLVVCFFVVLIGVVFSVWYYRKRKGIEMCSQGQCCCCCFISVVIIVLGIFFMLRIISYMYEHS